MDTRAHRHDRDLGGRALVAIAADRLAVLVGTPKVATESLEDPDSNQPRLCSETSSLTSCALRRQADVSSLLDSGQGQAASGLGSRPIPVARTLREFRRFADQNDERGAKCAERSGRENGISVGLPSHFAHMSHGYSHRKTFGG